MQSMQVIRHLQTYIMRPLSRYVCTLRWLSLLAILIAFVCQGSTLASAQSDPDARPRTMHRPTAKAKRRSHSRPPTPFANSLKQISRYLIQQRAKERHAKDTKHSKHDDHDAKEEAMEASHEEEKEGADYLGAYLYFTRQRAYPKNQIDWRAYPRAAAHRDQMPPAQIGQALGAGHKLLGTRWQFVGPTSLIAQGEWLYGMGPQPVVGRINAVAFDPQNANTFYIGAASGGVWKTTDGGVHWTPLSDNWPLLHVSSLAVDPNNNQVIYAGTGDFDGYAGIGFGIMKSMDGGATWINIGNSQFDYLSVSSILIDPANSNILLATTGRAPDYFGTIWRSTNAGATWTSVTTTSAAWCDLKVSIPDTNGQQHFYATGEFDGGFVYRSDNEGATWTALAPPLFGSGQYDEDSLKLATSPTNAKTVYLASGYDEALWKSTNAGNTWTDISANLATSNSDIAWGQAWYDLTLACSTRKDSKGNAQDVLYMGLIDLIQSPDGGTTWSSIGGPAYADSALLHVDFHALLVNPSNPNTLLIGNDGGLYLLSYNPTTNSVAYQDFNANLGITQFYACAVHPTDANQMLAGAQDNSSDAIFGGSPPWQLVYGGDGGYCAINPKTPAIQYATSEYLDVIHTLNTWTNSADITPNIGFDYVGFIAPLTLDAKTPNLLYAGTDHLYRWNESTQTWTPRLGNRALAGFSYCLQYIAVAPSDSNRLYTGSLDGQVWMSTNAGATWQEIDTGATSFLPGYSITSISINPTNPSDILVGLSGYSTDRVYQCSNTLAGAGITWTNISGSGATSLPAIPLNTICRDLDDPVHTFFVGMDVGMFYTTDGGAHWANATQPLGLPNVQINELKADLGTRYLTAATYGRGLWRISLPASLALAALGVSPTSIKGGTVAQGTVQLNELAPTGGTTVTLSSSNPALASVPPSVVVTAGTGSIGFSVQTARVINPQNVSIKATYQSGSQSATLSIVSNALNGNPTNGNPTPAPPLHSPGQPR